MVALMPQEVEANCAICGAPPEPECPHEGERLKLAMDQAIERWSGMQLIRDWVIHHARNQVIATFHHLRAIRLQAHEHYLETLPIYTLYHRYNGAPPLQPAQLQLVHAQLAQANQMLQAGVDQDWRTSCQRYPEVLDYYFNLIGVTFPPESDPMIQDPVFGAPAGGGAKGIEGPRRPKTQQRPGSGELVVPVKDSGAAAAAAAASQAVATASSHRKKERRNRSRGRGPSPPPQVPMVGSYHHRR